MRSLKKILSLLLVICMVVTMIPMTAMATETNTVQPVEGRIIMGSSVLSGQTSVWVDGVEYAVQGGDGGYYVDLPADANPGSMVTYTYHIGNSADVHTQYPIGMQVWALKRNGDGSFTPEKIEELENILQYSGSSIRITGNKGIRMITSIEKSKKRDLVSNEGLAGYKLLEYGTVLAWSSDLADGSPLVLGPDYAKYNYAYKKGEADPVFENTGDLMQYTNVLVGFTLDQCKDDIAMRPYMILEDENGQQMTIYGGIVQRSIGYIAWQNRNVFRPGTAAYNYVWEIIRHVYAQVSFETNGGTAIETAFVQKGNTLKTPATPEREGFIFAGWYTDAELTNEYIFDADVYENITLYAKWIDCTSASLSNFRADETFFIADQPYTAVFSVDAMGISGDVNIYCDDICIGRMNDDGIDGDAIADDNVYTYALTSSHPAGTSEFYAQSGYFASNVIWLEFFSRPTEEIRNSVEQIQENLDSILAKYADENGTMSFENLETALAEAILYAEELLIEGLVKDYEVTDHSVIYNLSCGLTLIFSPKIEGTYSGGSSDSYTIYTFQPLYTWVHGLQLTYLNLPSGITNEADLIPAAATALADEFENCTYSSATATKDQNIEFADIKNIGSNQIVLWQGHGSWGGEKIHSVLLTNDAFDWDAWLWNPVYFIDCCANRIVNTNGWEAVSSKYIDKYCGNMSNTYIYLGPCESGRDGVLAQAFLNKGAAAVIGNTRSVLCLYGDLMEYTSTKLLSEINPNTGEYYSLGEALAKAKSMYGNNDSAYGGSGAEPTLFGGVAAYNYRLGTARKGTLAGKIVKASDRTTPVTTASVTVTSGNRSWVFQPDANGTYSRSLPVGTYRIQVLADGYIDFNAYVTIEENQTIYMETFLMVEGEEGQTGEAGGTISNALTGIGIEGVRLDVRSGWNNDSTGDVLTTVTTNSSGGYVVNLPIGNYTLVASKDGFVSTMINIVVQPNMCTYKNASMTPIISGDNYRIVLTWGENPRDLDSHVVGTLTNGNSFHVYYAHKSQFDGDIEVCNLDYDDTTSYGPETITLNATGSLPYYYYIYRYAGSGTVASSGAQVKVYQGENIVATFNVPTDLGSGDYWNVFAIVNGQLVVRNTITNSSETSYASASGGTNAVQSVNAGGYPEYDDNYPAKD